LRGDYPLIVDYYHVNIGSEDKTELEKFRQTVMDTVSNEPSWNSQIVSMEAYKIKNELRERFSFNKGKSPPPYITRDEFDEIAKRYGVSTEGRINDILNDLHTLGICLWYNEPEMEDFNMLVLNPDLITNGIYRIINQSYNEHKHKLNTSKGTEILKNDDRYKYPREKVTYLFKLMKLYELAFFENTDNIFIPGILPIDMPDELPAFDDAKERLTMSFVVDKTLPPSITARIIVKRSEEIFDEKLLWRKGAALRYKKDSDTIALITEESRSIKVCVKGTEKTPYIASLRETIKAIFDGYKFIKPDLLYEVLIPEESVKNESPSLHEREKPLMLSEEIIKVHAKNKTPYLDPVTEKLLSLLETAIAYLVKANVTKNYNGPYTGKEKNMKKTKIIDSVIGEKNKVAIKSRNATVGSRVNQILPPAVTEEQFKQILEMLEKFLKSEQAEDELPGKDRRKMQTEIDEARKLGPKKGWEQLREFLFGAGNIIKNISTFLAEHPEIMEAIQSLFNR
jgi:hypothetical protein